VSAWFEYKHLQMIRCHLDLNHGAETLHPKKKKKKKKKKN